MSRRPREFSTTDVYHIIFRGNDKQDIFYDEQDKYIFLDRIKETKKKFNYDVYSYCLMDNHVHMIIRVKEEFLSKSMQNLEMRYSIYFNKKFNRSGHLFENRFYSKRVENLNYFMTVCKYIHRNPEKANMDKTESYKWSSYKEYIGSEKIINKSVLLHYFGDNVSEFKKYTLMNDDKEQMYSFAEFELRKKLSEEELGNIIKEKFDLKNPSEVSKLGNKKKDEILKSLKDLKGTSIAQVARVTSITPYYIKKIWK